MDMKQAMSERHMVRKYTDKPIPIEVAQEINERLNDINVKYHTDIQLIRGDSSAFNAAIKLVFGQRRAKLLHPRRKSRSRLA